MPQSDGSLLNGNELSRRLNAPRIPLPDQKLGICVPTRESDWTYNDACTDSKDRQLPPEKWFEKYPECAGTRQSPVNILLADTERNCESAVITGDLEFDSGSCSYGDLIYDPSIKYWEVLFDKNACEEAPYLTVDTKKYVLEKFQFHSKAEHLFNGETEDAELHMIHYNDQDHSDVLIVAVILDSYDQITEPTELANYLIRIATAADLRDRNRPSKFEFEMSDDEEIANPYNILPEEENYFSYLGSLTAPPCTENVRWMIVHMPRMISGRELHLLQNGIKFKKGALVNADGSNTRPVQDLNGRSIYACI